MLLEASSLLSAARAVTAWAVRVRHRQRPCPLHVHKLSVLRSRSQDEALRHSLRLSVADKSEPEGHSREGTPETAGGEGHPVPGPGAGES